MGALFFIPGSFLLFTGTKILVLRWCFQSKRKAINLVLITGLGFSSFLALKTSQLEYLEKKYPVRWWLSTPFDGDSKVSARELSSKMTESEWVSLCKQFGFLSFKSHIFGGLHSAKCYFYGATFYQNKSLCKKLPTSDYQGSYVSKPPSFPLQRDCFGS
jgi:hypothetical protein